MISVSDVIGWKFNNQPGMRCAEVNGTMVIVEFPGGVPTQEQIDIWTAEYSEYLIRSDLEAAVDDHIDAVATAKGYGKRYRDGATEACMKYAAFPNKYQAESIAFGQWIVTVWDYVFQVQSDVIANLRPIPTKEQLIAELPVMVWPV